MNVKQDKRGPHWDSVTKLSKEKQTKESWKQQEKQFVMCKFSSIRLTANFSWEIMAIGRQWNDTFNMLKEMSTRNPIFGKISFKKDKTFGMNKNRICY